MLHIYSYTHINTLIQIFTYTGTHMHSYHTYHTLITNMSSDLYLSIPAVSLSKQCKDACGQAEPNTTLGFGNKSNYSITMHFIIACLIKQI